MHCTECGTANPDAAKFCQGCGTKLQHTCPSCSHPIDPAAKFCGECGHRIAEPASSGGAPAAAATPAPQTPEAALAQYIPKELQEKLEHAQRTGGMQGERRVVTILFCDVTGSTAAAEQLDPEEWAEIMNGAFEHLIVPVYTYEGTLARLMGDAILAFFGAPIGHEDDPERAVRAGLDILAAIQPYRQQVKREWGIDFDVRVGINTGLVVVGEVGSDLRMEYTAMGDAVNLASRMESTAAPGTLQISEDTHKHIAPLFETESNGDIEVKGKVEPVPAYRVLRPKAEPGRVRGIAGHEAPLVGRDAELARLREAVDALRAGRGQIVSVLGEAGLGKSRLTSELRATLVEEGLVSESKRGIEPAGTPIAWAEAPSLSYQTNTPYAPFCSMVHTRLDLDPNTSDDAQYLALRERLDGLMGGRAEATAPFIADLAGLPLSGEAAEMVAHLDPPLKRSKVFSAMLNVLQAQAVQRPTIIVLEDLHWADSTSLDLVEQALKLVMHAPLMFVILSRPRRQEGSWRIIETAERDLGHAHTRLDLSPLDDAQARRLISELLAIDGLTDATRDLILEKAQGNPYFVEEMIRSLLDREMIVHQDGRWVVAAEVGDIAVPDNLVAVLTTRLDSLPESCKRAAQDASIIGREFTYDGLAAVSADVDNLNDALFDLQRRDLVEERARLPVRRYAFKHVLIQEAAYDSLLLKTRRKLHLRYAEHLEASEPGLVQSLARHFMLARERVRALPYLVSTGERAAAVYATQDAIEAFNEAIGILDDHDDKVLARRAYAGLGDAHLFLGQIGTVAGQERGALDVYQDMVAAARRLGCPEMEVNAWNKQALLTAGFLDPEAGETMLAENLERARDHGDKAGQAETLMTYCAVYTSRGDFSDAEAYLSEAEGIGREIDMAEARLYGLAHIANTKLFMLQFEDCKRVRDDAVALATERGNRKWLSELTGVTSAFLKLTEGDLKGALELALEGAAIAREIGHIQGLAPCLLTAASLQRYMGDIDASIRTSREAKMYAKRGGAAYLSAAALCVEGTAMFDISPELGDSIEDLHQQALSAADQPLGQAYGTLIWSEISLIALQRGQMELAEQLLDRATSERTATINLAHPQVLLAKAMQAMIGGDMDTAQARIAECGDFLAESGMKQYDGFHHLIGGMVKLNSGDAEAALADFDAAIVRGTELSMRPVVWKAHGARAAALGALEREAEAESAKQDAKAAIEAAADLFRDWDWREAFLTHELGALGFEVTPILPV